MRSAHAESLRLHRARRAGEIQRRDAVLCKADLALQDLKAALGRALIAASRGRYDTPELIAEAVRAVEDARLALRHYFDGSGR
jgi:hypothetical protein